MSRKDEIAKLNDQFRKNTKDLIFTQGVRSLAGVRSLVEEVRQFDKFTSDNDPHGEHDFGSLAWRGHKIFWKIDYYDQRLEYGEDPLSPGCRRVLTVMMASEY